MKKIFILFILFVVTSVFGQGLDVNLKGELVNYNFHYKAGSTIMPVSITPYADGYYLIANYTDVFLLNTDTGDMYKFDIIRNADESKNLDSFHKYIRSASTNSNDLQSPNVLFMPTGLFYSRKYEKLYVANYKGDNILIFNVDLASKTLLYQGEIQTKNTKGPENVFVTNDGNYLACANYDGSSVSLFELSTYKKFKEIWSTDIGQAHGVTVQDGFVYATGLTKRKIYKLDIKNGKIVKSIGKIGSDPSENGFLWPTSINNLDDESLVVSDAHTGYIYILDKDSLHIKSYFGGNSLGYNYLHMPYCVVVDGERYLIASTFQDRIVEGSIKNWAAEKSFIFSGRKWASLDNKEINAYIDNYDVYIYKKGPKLKILGKEYTMGFGHLYPVDKDIPILRLPDTKSINNNAGYFYFTDLLKIKNSNVLFSPQSKAALYIKEVKGVNYVFPFELDSTDYWLYDGALINSIGQFDLSTVMDVFDSKIDNIEKSRHKNGLLELMDFYQIYNNEKWPFVDFSFDEFNIKFQEVFNTAAGKEFLKAYNQMSIDTLPAEIKNIAAKYYRTVLRNNYVDMNEFCIVQMLTGFVTDAQIFQYNRYIFEGCQGTNYYAGYSPKALETVSINDYVSANSIQDSCFLVENMNYYGDLKINITWYDLDHYGVNFDIYGFSENNNEFLLLPVKNNEPRNDNGLAVNTYHIKTKNKITKLKFILKSANKQNRLIMREFAIAEDDKQNKKNTSNAFSLNELISLNKKVNQTIIYGTGKDFREDLINGKDYASLIKELGSGHCGYYTYLLMREIKSNNEWRGYDIKTYDNRVHSVIEVNIGGKWLTFDPTLGIYYDKSINELISNNETQLNGSICDQVEMRFKGYCGNFFFKAVESLKMYNSFAGYEYNKLIKSNVLVGSADRVAKGHELEKLYDGNANTYFSSAGNKIDIKLNKMQVYKITLEALRYYDKEKNDEIIISPKEMVLNLYCDGVLVGNYKLVAQEPKLMSEIYFDNSTLIDQIELKMDKMYNTNLGFVLKSIDLF
ncbi:MAG: beta-propeller fold lactonase family protein [Deferribacterales bacterium]